MIFSTYSFLLFFLPAVLILYFALNSMGFNRIGKWTLVFASFFFYWYGSHSFLIYFIASVLFNYVSGFVLGKMHNRGINKNYTVIFLVFAILANVIFLGYFKYLDFLFENINLFIGNKLELPHIILPIGISFYTFQLIAYVVDSYRGMTSDYDFLDYLLFITFFPQLIVGPIVHHKDTVPQFENKANQKINFDNISVGLFLFMLGAVKKLYLADPLTEWSQAAFNHVENMGMFNAWMNSVSYTISYYFDLSAYADMAIGTGRMFNIIIPINFNSPYKARNFADYWRRWHITLSNFLGDYIFRGIFKKGDKSHKFYLGIFITFLVSGMWHGAGWNFIVWGIINGLFVMSAHFMKRKGWQFPLIIAWALTFLGAVLMRILFVSTKLSDALKVFITLVDINKFDFITVLKGNKHQILLCIIGFIITVALPNSNQIAEKFKTNYKFLAITIVLIVAALLSMNKVGPFLYFQF